MKLVLLHGRKDPAQHMDDRGFDGPILNNVKFLRSVYGSMLTVGFKSRLDVCKAYEQTGWDFMGLCVLEMVFTEDMVSITPKGETPSYFGDWELQEDRNDTV